MDIFKAIGIVISFLVLLVLTIVSMYITYILAIGVFIFGSIYIVYRILKAHKSLSLSKQE